MLPRAFRSACNDIPDICENNSQIKRIVQLFSIGFAAQIRGKVIKNVAPFPGMDSTNISP